MSEIKQIPVARIHPHPDNPRKDLGDLTELVESIKVNGILQNLTIIPFFGKDECDEETNYTVIIGHRRLAAANEAGLETVPCVIRQMSREEQIATMLAENMQRTDLTVYEQAKSFQQLSIDFGKSVADISAMSGFSETTVRRRTKLAELDEKKFQKACRRGATLFDFAELDKVEDPEDREVCLDAIGTQNFKNSLKDALAKQKNREKRAAWEKQLAAFATKIEKSGFVGDVDLEMDYVRNYGTWTPVGDVEIPEDAGKVRYFYTVSDIQISVYKEHVADPERDAAEEERRRIKEQQEARYQQLRAISRRHYELRRDFVREYGAAKQNAAVIIRNAADALIKHLGVGGYSSSFDMEELARITGLTWNENEGALSGVREAINERPEKMLLAEIFWMMERGQQSYVRQVWDSEMRRYVNRYNDNQTLDSCYYFLEELGYECSDEEIQMRRGTHPLFDRVELDHNQ